MTSTAHAERLRAPDRAQGVLARMIARPQVAALVVGLVPAAAVAARGVWRDVDGAQQLSLFDDAMISMSYARTMAGGDGLVWFPGADPVEGITNLAWTMTMAALHAIGLSGSQVAAAMMLVSLATVWCAAGIGHRLTRAFSDGSNEFSFAMVLVVAANLPLLFWAVRGMEVGLITMCTLAACWLVLRLSGPGAWDGRAVAGLVAVVAVGLATRIDFVIVPVCLAVWVLMDHPRHRTKIFTALAAASVATLAALTAFRFSYYGGIVPNTYHLKASGVSLSMRLTRGVGVDLVMAGAYLLPAAAMIGCSWRRLDGGQRRIVNMLVLVAAGHVAYSTWVGGDAWEWFLLPNRYLTPGVVCLSIAGVAATFAALTTPQEADGERPQRGWTLVVVLIAIGPWLTIWVDDEIGDRIDAWAGLSANRGAALFLPPLLLLLVAGWFVGRLRAGDGPGCTARRTALGLAVLLTLSAGFRVTQLMEDDGNRFSRLGTELAAVTAADATIAVGAAGGTQYWSERPMVDLLGKNDPVVARSEPATPHFVPGHNKFDLGHSLDVLRPDVVAQGVDPSALLDRGFVPVVPERGSFTAAIPHLGDQVIFARPGSDAIRWDRVRRVG